MKGRKKNGLESIPYPVGDNNSISIEDMVDQDNNEIFFTVSKLLVKDTDKKLIVTLRYFYKNNAPAAEPKELIEDKETTVENFVKRLENE